MARSARVAWIVQSVSLFRIAAGLLFVCLAFQDVPSSALIALYGLAMISDLIDGLLASRLGATSHFGRVLDLVGDKSLTIISLLYAAARGIALAPLALIGTREIAVIGMRLVTIRGTQLLPTNRLFGGILAFVLWGSTAFLIAIPDNSAPFRAVQIAYWIVAIVCWANLVHRVRASSRRIIASLEEG